MDNLACHERAAEIAFSDNSMLMATIKFPVRLIFSPSSQHVAPALGGVPRNAGVMIWWVYGPESATPATKPLEWLLWVVDENSAASLTTSL